MIDTRTGGNRIILSGREEKAKTFNYVCLIHKEQGTQRVMLGKSVKKWRLMMHA